MNISSIHRDTASGGFVRAAAVLALGLIVGACIGAYAFLHVHAMDNTLAVTGSASTEAVADSAKWTVSASRSAFEGGVPAAQERIGQDTKIILAFFEKAGIESNDTQVSPVSVDQEYSSDANAPRRYNVRVQITVQSKDPKHIEALSKEISALAEKGVVVSANPPEYYISSLPEIRVELIGKAVQDARERAKSIAGSVGQRVGALKSASSGVVQVMAPNSVDVSDYGSYDTSTIDKKVMVTARAVFLLR